MATDVFPAGAGMNRLPAARRCRGGGVPRGCGDEPFNAAMTGEREGCSPRVRG